jgi:pimeloyl-ACP methyl ester carboxylesterase
MPLAAHLHYFASGADDSSRPPVILLHGAGGHHLYWPPQIRRLSDQRIFALDLAGHGKSAGLGYHTISDYTGSVLGFVQALGLSAVVLVGHSMGGAIALDAALRFPHQVLGLGLVATGARLRVSPDLLQRSASASTFPAAVRLASDLSFAKATNPRLKELASQRMAEVRPPVFHGDLLACEAFDVREQLAHISAPTLIVCGAADRMTPPRYSEFLAQHIAGSRFEMVPDAGHMVMLEKPDEVAGLLGDFLGTISYRPGQ